MLKSSIDQFSIHTRTDGYIHTDTFLDTFIYSHTNTLTDSDTYTHATLKWSHSILTAFVPNNIDILRHTVL